MALTGLGFAGLDVRSRCSWSIAFVGTLNPTAGDVSVFLPTEQALLGARATCARARAVFARYNVAGALLVAVGSLATGLPELAVSRARCRALERAARRVRGATRCRGSCWSRCIAGSGREATRPAASAARAPLARSRSVVLRLTALFSLDSFGGGFAVQSLLALWLFQRFALSLARGGRVLLRGVAAVGAARSSLSPRLAARIGLIQTMVFTHLPANAFLIAAAFMPTAPLALGCLLARSALSQMDVPARQSYVMAVVPPEERAAAASVTNVPRSLAGGARRRSSPAPCSSSRASAGRWSVAGVLKIVYDLLLLWQFRRVNPV